MMPVEAMMPFPRSLTGAIRGVDAARTGAVPDAAVVEKRRRQGSRLRSHRQGRKRLVRERTVEGRC